ncbi:hypothetical protein [Streptomyces sp. NPDC051286]|uniref:hypothetical protein n=1 Tax=Streptomyces sp. NPDC051286 TaxID=3365647 RepID=UPI0037B629F3
MYVRAGVAMDLGLVAELSRRFAWIYTTVGTQDPLYQRLSRQREGDFRETAG